VTPAAPARSTSHPWPVLALVLLFFLGVGATLPALPGAVREAGAGSGVLGVALGVFPFAALAGRLVSGRATDRGGRVATLRAGLLVTAVAGGLLVLPVTVPGLVAARVLHGLADALVYTAASAWVLDRTPEDRRPGALSLLGAAIWSGYALGPLAGAALDLPAVGALVLGSAVVGLALTRGLPDRLAQGEPARGLRSLLPRGVALPGTALGLGNLGYAALVGFLVVHLDDRGGRGAVALTAFSVAVLLGRLVVVPLAARVGVLRTLPYGLTAMAAGLLVIAGTGSTVVAAVAATAVGLGYCLPFPALATLVAGRVPASQRGAAIGALTAFYDVFVGVGSVLGGLVADRSGTPAVFVLAAVGVLAAAAVNVVLARQDRRRHSLVEARPD
jgi:MFS family permease